MGGSEAVPNEFVSMVGLVDIGKVKPDFPVFCGGAISEFDKLKILVNWFFNEFHH